MTIILDFDDILFDNTLGLKKALVKIFKKHKADFWEIYSKIRTAKGGYSPKKHLALLKKKNKEIDIKGIEKEVDKLFLNIQQFLFPDALGFLKALKGHNLILLSWGDGEFQKRKIYGLGKEFVSFFDKIIAGPVEKARVVKKILKLYKSRPVIFVDDKPQELKKIKDNFKDVILIRVTRDTGQNLEEVEKIIKTY